MATSGEETVEGQTEPPICGLGNQTPIPKEISDLSSLTTANGSVIPPNGAALFDPELAHTLPAGDICTLLGTHISNGLADAEAARRLQQDGPNKIEGDKGIPLWKILLRQVSNSLTAILVITVVVSYIIQDYVEGSLIVAVVLFNTIAGFIQDLKAERTIQSLYKLSAPKCKVIRDGEIKSIAASDVVKGDVVALANGDIVPADIRLVGGTNLAADEALLTGESVPVHKHPESTFPQSDMALGDRVNMVYSATIITRGRGTGVVTATGMATKVGQIASDLRAPSAEQLEEQSKTGIAKAWLILKNRTLYVLGLKDTPLKNSLNGFALVLFALAALLAIIVFSAHKWHVDGEVLLYGIVVAVAVVPESLSAVIIISSSLGVERMAEGNVIVRDLNSLEAVGGVTHICSDKTGTLTQGKMIVQKIWLSDSTRVSIDGVSNPNDPTSGQVQFNDNPNPVPAADEKGGSRLQVNSALTESFLNTLALCNTSKVFKREDGNWAATGDPTEIALQVLACRFNVTQQNAARNMELVSEFPFDSTIKRMTVVYGNEDSEAIAFTKGAVEALLPLLDEDESKKQEVTSTADSFAAQGLRVLCVAQRRANAAELSTREDAERHLTFLGLAGIRDPPRPESAEAVRKCHEAGTTVIMLTGDHVKTATSIARECGILQNGETPDRNPNVVMEAKTFDAMPESSIDALDQLPLVIARCTPRTKVRMVDAIHRRGGYCSMTGDGVNDSPALKKANIGIAMGMNGSDVAKEASKMVLTDDNFASIVVAVQEGRRLFDNVQKFLLNLLVSNICQVELLLIALAFKDRSALSVFPLSPIEILWANLITSAPLAIGLGIEEAQPDVMSRPPHDLKVGVFTKELIIDKFVYGTGIGSLCLMTFTARVYGLPSEFGLGHDCNEDYNETCSVVFRARATTYATITLLLIITAFEAKHFTRSLFNMYPEEKTWGANLWKTFAKNKFLFWGAVSGVVLLFPILYIPVFNRKVFKHQGITWEWGLVLASMVGYVAVVETWKALKRHFNREKPKRLASDNSSAVSV